MKIKSLSYTQHVGTPREWKIIDCTFSDLNLIVGENAVGKSRTLNVIRSLADLVSGHRKSILSSGNYDITFDSPRNSYDYRLQCENKKVLAESLHDGEVTLLAGKQGQTFILRISSSRESALRSY